MSLIDRRVFLKAGGLALVSFGFAPQFLGRTALAAGSRAPRKKVLVAIFQRGALDGLSAVVPYGEAAYYAARSSLAVPPPGRAGGALDLDGFFALHPSLDSLLPLFQGRTLAAVHGVGSPDSTRSHFDAQDYMELGTPGRKSTPDGWLNRLLQLDPEGHNPLFRAVAMGGRLPRILHGPESAIAISDLDALAGANDGGGLRPALEGLYDRQSGNLLGQAGGDLAEAAALLRQANPGGYTPAADYPRGRFGESLKQIAQLIKADLGVEVAFADVGGWDTHVNQGGSEGQLSNRLREFGDALAAFHKDLGDRMEDVVLVTMSEFGRTVRQNGSSGTDHGHATCLFVMGSGVRGGRVYGEWPGLEREQLYEGRDLALTSDFRSVFGEVVEGHLGVSETERIFPGFASGTRLGLMG
jgi:uncharacterized protein (DUF1501 family)